jgi:hypothetical protein
MQRALAHALLVAGLALAVPAPAQIPGVPPPAVQADAHVFSAFTTRSDPRVLADNVALGPALRGHIGEEKDSRRIYDALMASVAGKPVRSRTLSISEAVGYTSLGVNPVDPIVLVEADDVRLLMQYSIAEKNVAFVEQLAGTAVALTPQQAPQPEPIVERALPTEPPPPPPAAAATVVVPAAAPVVAAPAPKPAAAPKPRAAAVAAVPAAVPAGATPAALRPAQRSGARGECVIKPVMSEDDLWNCSAPGQASSPQTGTPAPATAAAASLAPPATDQPRVECVVKPVMTEADLRACAAESRSRPSAPAAEVATAVASPGAAAQPAAAPAVQAAPRECVIKPVMTEEDLRICAAASRSRPVAPVETAAPAKAVQPSAPPAPAAPRDCVVKPVMTEEDLRACGAKR